MIRRRSRAGQAGLIALAGLALATGCGGGGDDAGSGAAAVTPAGDPAAGEALARSEGCTGCHDAGGRDLAGPTWKGLAGSEVVLADGTTVVADAAYLRRSITDPGAEIVDGYAATMPKLPLGDDEIDDLVAYLASL